MYVIILKSVCKDKHIGRQWTVGSFCCSLVDCSSADAFFEGGCVQQPMFMTRKLSRSYPCGFGMGSTHCIVSATRIVHLQ